MPVDKNEAPEGCFAVENDKSLTIRGNCRKCAFFSGACPEVGCTSTQRNDSTSVYFIKKESEKTMEEYEHMTANTLESWRTIVDAIFRGDCEMRRDLFRYKDGELEGPVVWDRASCVENGREYRWKKPAQPKVKKLVDRTPEEFWPMIGKWWYRYKDKKTRNRYLINDSDFLFQENKEIALLGSEDWQPMQKEIEVEG
jgi:hypothetical protein